MVDYSGNAAITAVGEFIKEKIPVSLPAAGGSADTADCAKYLGTFGAPDQYYGSMLPMRCLYNKFGDLRFGLTTDTDNEIRVDYASNAETAKTLSDFVGVRQENLDDAPPGFCCADGDSVNSPFGFWSTVITVGHDENYRQQIALPWAEGETYIMPKYRVMDNGVWYGWKQCNPIRSVNISGSTDEYGSLLLWSIGNSIPIAAVGDGNRIFSPFIGGGNNYYLNVRDPSGNIIANTAASATVFFI